MKKLLFLLMLPIVLLLSGCDDDGRKKVNPKKLEGIWEVYDASTTDYLGRCFTFLNDSRLILKNTLDLSSSINIYEVVDKELQVYRPKNGIKNELKDTYNMKFEKSILSLIKKTPGDGSFWMKLKKVEELPCDA